jgi:hypothetical protein
MFRVAAKAAVIGRKAKGTVGLADKLLALPYWLGKMPKSVGLQPLIARVAEDDNVVPKSPPVSEYPRRMIATSK